MLVMGGDDEARVPHAEGFGEGVEDLGATDLHVEPLLD